MQPVMYTLSIINQKQAVLENKATFKSMDTKLPGLFALYLLLAEKWKITLRIKTTNQSRVEKLANRGTKISLIVRLLSQILVNIISWDFFSFVLGIIYTVHSPFSIHHILQKI